MAARNSLFQTKKRKNPQCNKSPHFFFADRFGLISLVAVGDWIFVDLSILPISYVSHENPDFQCHSHDLVSKTLRGRGQAMPLKVFWFLFQSLFF